jgi:hypothetical protein
VTRDTSRIFEGAGEILLKSGEVAVSAVGKYMKMPIDKITEFKELEWQVTPLNSDPRELEV